MRRFALILAAAVAIISGCRDRSGIRGYWYSRDVGIEDFKAAEEQFADFAEMAVSAPRRDAFAAVNALLKKASGDEVTYLVYTDWISRAFGLIASPCYSPDIFIHAADKILSKGMLSGSATDEYRRKREFCLHNRQGSKVLLPYLAEGEEPVPLVQRTVFLVVDQSCPSCRESMVRFLSPEWSDAWLVALCYGRGPLPEERGWDCRRLSPDQTVLDVRQGPFFFVTTPDGRIEQSYTPVNDIL